MRWDVLVSVMKAEMRLTRRLVRYWIFLIPALLVGLGIYLYYCVLHAFISSFSATAASIGPRYLIAAMGLYFLLFFVVGLVFMGFDVRARDQRERMAEVLDSRPISNAELLGGRFLAQLLMAWIPALFMVLCMEALGFLLPALGAPFGATLEPMSLLSFLFIMCPPALAWALGVTFFVTLLVRKRLPAAVVSILLIGGAIWASFRMPPVWSVFFDFGGAYVITFPSDLLPGLVDLAGLLQRLGISLAALAFLAFAIAIHPRLDSTRSGRKWGAASLLLIGALAFLGMSAGFRSSLLESFHRWRDTHEASADRLRPDIEKISGRVILDPGGDMSESLDLLLQSESDVDSLLFSFNPGLKIISLQVDGVKTSYTWEDGLMEIKHPLKAGDSATLHIKAGGRLETEFAYLDSVRTPEELPAYEGQLYLLGFRRSLNDRRYVALMPGVCWLPRSGVLVDKGVSAAWGRDFFKVDLEIDVPEGYDLVGPDSFRIEGGDSGRQLYRVAPEMPLDQVAVLLSHFIHRSVEINGKSFEIYLSPSHSGNLDVLAEAGEEIVGKLREKLEDLDQGGLSYPFNSMRLVEIPNVLRGFGGGWRLDTELSPPGMVLMKETSFPTARFDVPFRDPSKWKNQEGGIPAAKAERLETFFINDFSGGNIFSGAGRSLFLSQTGVRGEGRGALRWTLDSLTTLLVSESRTYFSAHLYTSEMRTQIGSSIQHFLMNGRKGRFIESVLEVFSSRSSVWESVQDSSLVDMDPWKDPQKTIDAYSLKAGSLAQALYDEMGVVETAGFLKELRSSFSGRNFTMDDFLRVLGETRPEAASIAANLLTGKDLPGYIVGDVKLYRLADDAAGSPRYQFGVTLVNSEDAPGLVRLLYSLGEGNSIEENSGELHAVNAHSALRFSRVFSRIPSRIRVQPYVSLNRKVFDIELPQIDADSIVEEQPVEGVEEIPAIESGISDLVVDDLDEGFMIVGEEEKSLRLKAKQAQKKNLDQGVPVDEFGPMPSQWSRASAASAWGKYRHTVVWTRKGKGMKKAVFKVQLPEAGQWQLEMHLPRKSRFRFARTWGKWKLELVSDGDVQNLSFDAENAVEGWNVVDVVSLEKGSVEVRLSDAGSGMIVVADAIRLVPVVGESR